MKDQYLHIDEIFRKKFEGFEPEPPTGMWPKIKARISGKGGTGMGSVKTILLSTVVMITAGALLLVFLNNSQPRTNTHSKFIAQSEKLSTNTNYLNETTDTETENLRSPEPVKHIAPVVAENTDESTSENKIIETDPYQPKASTNEIVPVAEKTKDSQKNFDIQLLQPHSGTQILAKHSYRNLYANDNRTPESFNFKFDADQKTIKSPVESYFKIGGFINPEVVFYPDDSVSNSRNFNFGLDLRYYRKNFFIRTGLNISIARDEGKYNINYKQLEYLGSYQDVYNVTFDTTESGLEPVYHTKTVQVYDSVEHATVNKEKNTYTYIQIPLLIGYQIERQKVNYSVMAGPCYSALINRNIPNPEYPEGARILNISSNVAERINSNWQMVFGVGINYKLSRNVEISFEPTLRYYLNSTYRRDIITTKHPYSIGLRAGILFKLQ